MRTPSPPSTLLISKPSARVVVLHGWGLSGYATHYWCNKLRPLGLAAVPFAYQSVRRTLDDNADRLAIHLEHLPGSGPVHLVGHSLGGILIMQCLAKHRPAALGRVVMVGTPFQGSIAARRLQSTSVGRAILGKSIVQWHGVDQAQLPSGLEVGVIAGTRPMGLGRVVGKIPEPHDGTVSLQETRVPFARDTVVLKVTHTEMLFSPLVVQHMTHFLSHGLFAKS